MSNIKFEISEPYFENMKFGICIDMIDYVNEKIDSKHIYMCKIFCFFELPKLGIPKIENLMSGKNIKAMEWLGLYADSLKEKYEQDWENQPNELILTKAETLPTLEDLRSLKIVKK